MATGMQESHILVIQIIFIAGFTMGSQTGDFRQNYKWLAIIARYVFYLLTMKATKEATVILYNVVRKNISLDMQILAKVNRKLAGVYVAAIALVLYHNQSLFTEDFTWLFAAFLVVNYVNRPMISYGKGMACSFYEGYLVHIMPSDGVTFGGFLGNIKTFEAKQGQVFPVQKLFLVVPKSLHCHPDLAEYNKLNRPDLPHLEALKSLEGVTKDVAAVKNRVYRNSVYKIYRPNGKPVCLAVECPTPLHTLYKVLQNRIIYGELVEVDVQQIVEDFCRTLMAIVDKSPACRGKLVLVHFDDEDESVNLADVLLNKIRELEPNFEDILNRAETV